MERTRCSKRTAVNQGMSMWHTGDSNAFVNPPLLPIRPTIPKKPVTGHPEQPPCHCLYRAAKEFQYVQGAAEDVLSVLHVERACVIIKTVDLTGLCLVIKLESAAAALRHLMRQE